MSYINLSSLKSKLNSIQRQANSELNHFKQQNDSALRKLKQELAKLRNYK